MSIAASFGRHGDLRPENRRIVVGVAVSMTAHLLFLLGYSGTGLSLPVPAQEPAPIAVTIRPPPPAAAPQVIEPAPARPATPAAPKTARRAPPKKVIAVPDSPDREAQPDPFTVQQPDTDSAEAPTDAAPRFDMETAKRLARENAHMRDPSREGTALAQFPEKPLETETKLARAIGKAKRRNCKDGIPGGLLAPLYLMMDKKNSGCKW